MSGPCSLRARRHSRRADSSLTSPINVLYVPLLNLIYINFSYVSLVNFIFVAVHVRILRKNVENRTCMRTLYVRLFIGAEIHTKGNTNIKNSLIRIKLGIHMHLCVCLCLCVYGKYQNPKINREGILIYGCVCVYAFCSNTLKSYAA